jgi:hypothetical protein
VGRGTNGHGACKQMNFGSTVYISDTTVFSGIVRVRPQGEDACFWTVVRERQLAGARHELWLGWV